MGGRKQRKKNIIIEREIQESFVPSNHSVPARHIRKNDLGAVIFGCTRNTINECFSNKLFGLPETHYSYIKNISPGLVLFLFNYSNRKLHGIFEAASHGQMNIDRNAWVYDGDDTEDTNYPAQVRFRIRQQCMSLAEKDFRPIIEDNYYEAHHFYFELDHDQTTKLITLFTSSATNNPSCSIPAKKEAGNATQNLLGEGSSWGAPHSPEKNKFLEPVVGLGVSDENLDVNLGLSYASVLSRNSTTTHNATSSQPPQTCSTLSRTPSDVEVTNDDEKKAISVVVEGNTWDESQLVPSTTDEVEYDPNIDTRSSSSHPSDDNPDLNRLLSTDSTEDDEETNENDNLESLAVKLMQEVEMLKGSQLKQTEKINLLEQELHESKLEVQKLRNRIGVLEIGSQRIVDTAGVIGQRSWFVESVFIVGGCDGSSWLSTLDSYFPSYDIKIPLNSMNFVKKYASAATFNHEIYHFGGMGSHSVESFNPTTNQWVSRPPLHWKNIHVAGASVNDKLFVVGGSNGQQCSSDVEYLDLNIGKWLPTHSMECKRSASAAAELNNALYVAGGYDGVSYLSSVERFDPREEAWYKLPSMNTRKGCHSMVVLNEKLYTLGGFDGHKYVSTVETFDTRMGSWVETEPMKVARGNFGAFVLGATLYAIGGLKENNQLLDNVECYKEGRSWVVADLKAIGKRSQFSAIVL